MVYVFLIFYFHFNLKIETLLLTNGVFGFQKTEFAIFFMVRIF
ncbi:hypothetical protein F383_28451 [Gossypium arboreum]|uniref:Uncharacterized protein n=1 Tax=Gossypium arboreum TaxID=29729 RepID=A0A0B0PAH1_GOSAR|nr:hypothetical protein F383_28451 [Gossypium arboreum]